MVVGRAARVVRGRCLGNLQSNIPIRMPLRLLDARLNRDAIPARELLRGQTNGHFGFTLGAIADDFAHRFHTLPTLTARFHY